MKNKKAISLIVLSITILVMAILAATVIIALEDSGIIGRSKNTTAKQNYSQEYTRLQVIKNGVLTDNLGEITVDEYITELQNKGIVESNVTTNADGSKSVVTKTGFIANVKQDGLSNLIISLGEANAQITLNPTTLSGDVTDGPITKTINVNTKNVSGDITWSTSNPNVATVTGTNSKATVTLNNIGTAVITASYGNAKATCNVTASGIVRTPTITLNPTTITANVTNGNVTKTITATTQNISGTITWTSSNTSVATVTSSGNTATVTIKAAGNATITASGGGTSATCSVVSSVTPSITLSKTSISKNIVSGTTATETITATTKHVSGTITWTSSNTSVATVSGNNSSATITFKGKGTATISASYGTAKATCTVSVTVTEAPGTATVTSSTLAETYFNTGGAPKTVQLSFTTVLNKSKPTQSLRLVYKFYMISAYGGFEYLDDQDAEITTTSTTINFTPNFTPAGSADNMYLVMIDVFDLDGNLLTTYSMEDWESGAYYGDRYYTFHISWSCMPAGTLILVEEEYEDENGKKRKRRKKKKIEDITYEDNLVVWDFENGCFTTAKPLWIKEKEFANQYNVLTFSDGTELKTVRQHRIFNKDLNRFTCPFSADTPNGTTTFNENGEEIKLVSQEKVDGYVEYYNIVTEYHMNIFAEGILTSCRLSNLYEIKDMKYVKDNRELIDEEVFEGIPKEYVEGLRLREQPTDINRGIANTHGNTVKDYVKNMLLKAKKK